MLHILDHIVRQVLPKERQYSHSSAIYCIFTNDSLILMSSPFTNSKKG